MNFVLRGAVCYSKSPTELVSIPDGCLVRENGYSRGVYRNIPEAYRGFPVADFRDHMILPGLCDLHVHASQYAFRAVALNPYDDKSTAPAISATHSVSCGPAAGSEKTPCQAARPLIRRLSIATI